MTSVESLECMRRNRIYIKLLGGLILFSSFFMSCMDSAEVNFNTHLDSAKVLRDASDFNGEFRELNLALEIDTTEDLITRLIDVQIEMQLWEDAIETCSLAIQRGYNLHDNYDTISKLYSVLAGNSSGSDRDIFYQKSLEYRNKSLKIKPSDYDGHIQKLQLHYNLGEYAETLALAYDMLREYPDSQHVRLIIGYALDGLKDIKGLKESCRSFVQLVKDSVRDRQDSLNLFHHYKLTARAELGSGSSWQTVDSTFQKALNIIPNKRGDDYASLLVEKGNALFRKRQYDLMCEDYRAAVKLGAKVDYDRIRSKCQ